MIDRLIALIRQNGMPFFFFCVLLSPLVASSYALHFTIVVLLAAYLGMLWNLLGGFGGQLSLGNSLYFGIGGYTYTKLILMGTSWFVAIIAAISLAGLASVAIGYPTFRYRVRGVYFTMATIAAAEIGRITVLNVPAFGAAGGLMLPIPDATWSSYKWPYLYVIAAMVLCAYLATKYFTQRQFGRSLVLLRANEDLAEATGICASTTKLAAFVATACGTAVGGAFFASYTLFVHPESSFGITLSVQMASVAILGGRGTVAGPIVGAIILIAIAELSRSMVGISGSGVHQMLHGIALISAALFFPAGIAGVIGERNLSNPTR